MVLVAFGLWQLKLAKDQLILTKKQLETSKNIFRTQSKRASIEAAVVECRRFSETIVQDALELSEYCKKNEITFFDDAEFIRTEDGFKIDLSEIAKDDAMKLEGAQDIINRYLNGLEAYALFFLGGVADENIAFHTNAKTFIKLAERGFKLFPICNIDEDDAVPIKSLYFRWRKKVEAKDLELEKEKIESKLSNYKQKEIKAIGT